MASLKSNKLLMGGAAAAALIIGANTVTALLKGTSLPGKIVLVTGASSVREGLEDTHSTTPHHQTTSTLTATATATATTTTATTTAANTAAAATTTATTVTTTSPPPLQGIGAATSLALADAGAHVVLVARSRGKLEEVASKIRSSGGVCTVLVVDSGDCDAVQVSRARLTGAYIRSNAQGGFQLPPRSICTATPSPRAVPKGLFLRT